MISDRRKINDQQGKEAERFTARSFQDIYTRWIKIIQSSKSPTKLNWSRLTQLTMTSSDGPNMDPRGSVDWVHVLKGGSLLPVHQGRVNPVATWNKQVLHALCVTKAHWVYRLRRARRTSWNQSVGNIKQKKRKGHHICWNDLECKRIGPCPSLTCHGKTWRNSDARLPKSDWQGLAGLATASAASALASWSPMYQDGTKWLLALVVHVIQAVDPPAATIGFAQLISFPMIPIDVPKGPKEFERTWSETYGILLDDHHDHHDLEFWNSELRAVVAEPTV